MRNRAAPWSSGLVLLAVACSGEDPEETPPAVQTVVSEVALQPFDSCAALEAYIEDTAVRMLRSDFDFSTPVLRGGGIPEVFEGGAPPVPTAGQDDGQSGAPSDFTRTNVQVAGVDEADFMKTDGTRIFVLSGKRLYLSRSWPPQDLSVVASVELEGWPQEMFLDEAGRAIVFSSWYDTADRPGGPALDCGPRGCGGYGGFTRVTVLDTAEDQLRILREIVLPGGYVSSRRIGGSSRIILREDLALPYDLEWWPEGFEGDPGRRPRDFERALDEMMDRNEARIRARSLEDWIHRGYVLADGARSDLPLDCARFHRPNAPVRLGLTTIATLDLSAPTTSLAQTSILGEVGEVYASRDALYLATPHWWWSRAAEQRTHTYIHKLNISDPSDARYVGSGGVPGYVLDQFSMDEHLGYLRVATTVEETVESGDWWEFEVSNRVGVLSEVSGRLVEVGSVSGLAPTERIMSARFVEDRGFLVTFEQIDPLFTLDLSNPVAPRVVGELKIPGFSSYIHPLDADHLLTIGIDLPEPGPDGFVDWSRRAVKLTVFDVSDFANPREKFGQRVGTPSGDSEAQWSHKAFNYFPARKMLAIPYTDWYPQGRDYWNGFVSDLRFFEVDVATGITPKGRIAMHDLFAENGDWDWGWGYSPYVRRSVMAEDCDSSVPAGTCDRFYAYAVSDAGIRVVDMRDPSQTIATARFDHPRRY